MSRVELFEKMRRDYEGGDSIRGLAVKYRVHRRTVRQAISSPVPPERKVPVRASAVMGPWTETIQGWLIADLEMPKKQRHTARRVWERLVAEGAVVSESTVRRHVAMVKAELAGAGWKVAVPQTHELGAEGEADFGEFYAWVEGDWTRLWMFVMRLSASGRAFHWAFGNQTAESFYEGHNLAFAHFGGVPLRVRYDNLKPAVLRVLLGRERWENPRFVALRSHYGFDSFYCLPGPDGAHEKGGVEGEIGRFRRRWLVPVPAVSSIDELNEMITEADLAEDARVISGRPMVDGRRLTIGEHFASEQAHLRSLPGDTYEAVVALECRVDHKARICVRQAFYSVPARLVGQRVAVRLGASHLEVMGGTAVVASHRRSLHKGTETLTLDHYLEILVRKPGALPGATALVQARTTGGFTQTHEKFWDQARRRLGDQKGTRVLIDVLLEHRRLPAESVIAGMQAALRAGVVEAAVVAVEARRHADTRPPAEVIPIGVLSRYDRPAPSVTAYDQLLTGETR